MAEANASPEQMSRRGCKSGPEVAEIRAWLTKSSMVGSIIAYDCPKASLNWLWRSSMSSYPFSNSLL